MFSKAALFVASTFALLAAAQTGNIVNSCNAGQVYCCNSIQDARTLTGSTKAAFASFVPNADTVTGQFGVTCLAGSWLGASGNSCTQQTACCTGEQYNGGFVAGCSPFNANL